MVTKLIEKCRDFRFVNRCICWLLLLCMCGVCYIQFCSKPSICVHANEDVSRATSFERFLGAPKYYRNNDLLFKEPYRDEKRGYVNWILGIELLPKFQSTKSGSLPSHSYLSLFLKSWFLQQVFNVDTKVESVELELFTLDDVEHDWLYGEKAGFSALPYSKQDFWNEMGGCYIRSETFVGDSVRQDDRDGIIDGPEEWE